MSMGQALKQKVNMKIKAFAATVSKYVLWIETL